jgi:DNA-binding winged helix-turn-helix (wHTH) protein/TolB-like protein/Tfp pilus assembly protein PilF
MADLLSFARQAPLEPDTAGPGGSTSQGCATAYRFGDFLLTTRPLELTRAGEPCALQPQPARALELLVSRPGDLVTREELRERLWGEETHLEVDQAINFTICKIRNALDDDPKVPRYLETVPREGYRFVAPVHPSMDAPRWPEQATPSRRREGRRRVLFGHPTRTLLAVSLLAILAILGLVSWRSRGGEAPTALDSRLAVLPFAAVGPAAAEAGLQEVIEDELIAHLASRFGESVGVIALASARAVGSRQGSLEEVAGALRADYLLQGTLNSYGDNLQLTFRLWRARDRVNVWARTVEAGYERLPDLYDQVAEGVGKAVGAPLSPDREPPPQALTSAAWELQVRGRYLVSRGGEASLTAGLELLEKSALQAPAFAPGQVALARAYLDLSAYRPFDDVMPLADAAARRAIALDPGEAGAHTVLGTVALFYHHDYAAAESAFLAALSHSPRLATALHGYGLLLSALGHHEKALANIERAVDLDPATIYVISDLAQVLFRARQWSKADAQAQRNLELTPDDVPSLLVSERARRRLGDDLGALARWNEMVKLYDGPPATSLQEASSRSERWMRGELAAGRLTSLTELASRQVELGELDAAIASLRRACNEPGDWDVPFVAVDPRFDVLRARPDYQALGACLAPR